MAPELEVIVIVETKEDEVSNEYNPEEYKSIPPSKPSKHFHRRFLVMEVVL